MVHLLLKDFRPALYLRDDPKRGVKDTADHPDNNPGLADKGDKVNHCLLPWQ